MKFMPTDPPRVFSVGADGAIQIKDCARIELEPEEQVTFVTPGGAEHDVCRKSWGYYATPSLNGRLPSFGLRPALVKSYNDRYYLLLVEAAKTQEFETYMAGQRQVVVCWLDDPATLTALDALGQDGAKRG